MAVSCRFVILGSSYCFHPSDCRPADWVNYYYYCLMAWLNMAGSVLMACYKSIAYQNLSDAGFRRSSSSSSTIESKETCFDAALNASCPADTHCDAVFLQNQVLALQF